MFFVGHLVRHSNIFCRTFMKNVRLSDRSDEFWQHWKRERKLYKLYICTVEAIVLGVPYANYTVLYSNLLKMPTSSNKTWPHLRPGKRTGRCYSIRKSAPPFTSPERESQPKPTTNFTATPSRVFPAVNTWACTSVMTCHGETISTRQPPKPTGLLVSCDATWGAAHEMSRRRPILPLCGLSLNMPLQYGTLTNSSRSNNWRTYNARQPDSPPEITTRGILDAWPACYISWSGSHCNTEGPGTESSCCIRLPTI